MSDNKFVLHETDLRESFCRSGGPGGQNVNKVSTTVILRHIPSGLTVRVDVERSQERNRQVARERLLALLQKREKEAMAAKRASREKERRRDRPRPRGLKERILKAKKKRGELKRLRSGND